MATTNTKNGKPALYLVLLGALLFNLSSLPGFHSEVSTQSMDLLSSSLKLKIKSCDIEGQIQANGIAECEDLGDRKSRGRITVEKITPEEPEVQGPPNPRAPRVKPREQYKVTSELEGGVCPGGCTTSRLLSDLRDVVDRAAELQVDQMKLAATKLSEEKELARKERLCLDLENADGDPVTNPAKILECRIGKLKEMDPEKADDYYAEHIKEEVQALLQSQSPNDRALAMGILAKLGKDLNINCATRPGLQAGAQNPLLNHANLNPLMNPMRPQASSSRGKEERSFIKESTCDMWAFGTYNNNVQYLQLAAAQPNANRPAIKNALQSLKAGWGTYFAQRGLAIQSDPLGMFGMGDQLLGDLDENNSAMNKNLQAIVDKHKDLMQPLPANDGTQAAPGTGRMARGGIPPQHGVGSGTPSTGGAGPMMQPMPSPPGGRYMGAPRLGAPVGGPQMGGPAMPPPPTPRR